MNDLSRKAQDGARPDESCHRPFRPRRRHETAQSSAPVRSAVLDVGSTKIACLIGRTESDGTVRALGSGFTRSRGVRGGGITDLDEAERAIRAAVALAEEMADYRLRSPLR